MPSLPDVEAVRPPATAPAHTLPLGTRLREYEVRAVVGESACSIVYLAWDHTLQRKVALKEYMPAAMAGRMLGSTNVVVASERHLEAVRAGLRGFLNEARVLARFDHPSLVKIYRFWEENGTAYVAMPYYEGPTLQATLAELGHVPTEAELRAWLKPVLNAVTLLHDSGTWHQNIGPDEILLTPFGPVLLGLAGAAHAIQAIKHTPAAALKPGYAAIEQYGSATGTTRGPWTDLYALAAVVHLAITGEAPPPAADRLNEDRLRPLSAIAAGLYSVRFLAAIDAALALQPRRRPADHAEFRALMGDIEPPEAVSLAPRPDLMQEPFEGTPPTASEITIPDPPIAASAPVATPTSGTVPAARPKLAAPVATKAPDGDRAQGDREAPSWMQARRARNFGKRALYGVIAGTFALIGIAALVLQFATRPAPRAPSAAVPAPTLATARGGPAETTATTKAAPTTLTPTSTSTSISTSRSPSPSTTMTAGTPAAAPGATSASARAAAAAIATPPPLAPTPAIPSARTAAAAIAAATPAAPRPSAGETKSAAGPMPTAAQTQARCIEILQKASLEKITPAETDFFKRECK